jgi:HK97 family phage major capsid protein
MKTSNELKQLRANKLAEVEALVQKAQDEKREFTQEEETRFNAIKLEIETLKGDVQKAEEREELLRASAEARRAGGFADPVGNPSQFSKKEEKELRNFKFTNMVRHLMNPAQHPLEGVEKEVLQEGLNEARSLQVPSGGFRIPASMIAPVFNIRAQQATGASTGAEFVPEYKGTVIESLKPFLVLARAGAREIPVAQGLGNVSYPRNGGVTAAWAATENATAAESTATIDSVDLSPKRLSAFTKISKQLIYQAPYAVEQIFRNEYLREMAAKIDAACIYGGGTGEPTGIIANADVPVVAIGTNGGALTYAKVLELERTVANLNGDADRQFFITNPKVREAAKQIKIDDGSGLMLFEILLNRMIGYETFITSNVPSNLTKGSGTNLSSLLYGDFSQVMIASWGGFDIMIDPYTVAKDNAINVIGHVLVDCGIAQPDKLALIKDITTA